MLIGFKPHEFWELTPCELFLALEVENEKRISAYNESVTCAWYTALFSRQEKLRDLEEYLHKTETRAITEQEKLQEKAALNRVFGD